MHELWSSMEFEIWSKKADFTCLYKLFRLNIYLIYFHCSKNQFLYDLLEVCQIYDSMVLEFTRLYIKVPKLTSDECSHLYAYHFSINFCNSIQLLWVWVSRIAFITISIPKPSPHMNAHTSECNLKKVL